MSQFSELQVFGQNDFYSLSDQQSTEQYLSRKRTLDISDPLPSKRINRGKENVSPDMNQYMMQPLYQSTPINAGPSHQQHMGFPMHTTDHMLMPPPQMPFFSGFQFPEMHHPGVHGSFDQSTSSSGDSGIQSKKNLRPEVVLLDSVQLIHWRRSMRLQEECACLARPLSIRGILIIIMSFRYIFPLRSFYLECEFRKAKSKDGGKNLREKLGRKGIELPAGRRKTAQTTAFTALCEKEAVIMAADFSALCDKHLNTQVIGQHMACLNQTKGYHTTRSELEMVKKYLMELVDVFNEIPENPQDYIDKNGATQAINVLSLLTHGFGHNAFKGVLKAVVKIFNARIVAMDRKRL
uniref:TF_AP-2 domain-containing protein n=1 Tax=Heterorhabditis bacteriophora TaxID=37862 RepID=A0A1I7WNG5_HETBA